MTVADALELSRILEGAKPQAAEGVGVFNTRRIQIGGGAALASLVKDAMANPFHGIRRGRST
jgi:hypothetical protein